MIPPLPDEQWQVPSGRSEDLEMQFIFKELLILNECTSTSGCKDFLRAPRCGCPRRSSSLLRQTRIAKQTSKILERGDPQRDWRKPSEWEDLVILSSLRVCTQTQVGGEGTHLHQDATQEQLDCY